MLDLEKLPAYRRQAEAVAKALEGNPFNLWTEPPSNSEELYALDLVLEALKGLPSLRCTCSTTIASMTWSTRREKSQRIFSSS